MFAKSVLKYGARGMRGAIAVSSKGALPPGRKYDFLVSSSYFFSFTKRRAKCELHRGESGEQKGSKRGNHTPRAEIRASGASFAAVIARVKVVNLEIFRASRTAAQRPSSKCRVYRAGKSSLANEPFARNA